MDAFSKLPPEIRTEIIINVESEASIMQLIRASPVMLSQYTTCQTSIQRGILTNLLAGDTNGDILQDALAIIHFPSTAPTSSIPTIQRHVEQWMAEGFPNPFSPADHSTIQKLYRLFSRLVIFIEDYVSKATDPFPPRAYLGLPDLSGNTGVRFKGRVVDVKPVYFSDLTSTERHRFLRAFLRYELLCKAHPPRVWKPYQETRYAGLIKTSYDKLQPTEYRALYCVHEYFKSLYGAVFAHCQNSWLPDRPDSSSAKSFLNKWPAHPEVYQLPPSAEHGLLYPDIVYFSATDYLEAMDIREIDYVDVLPCLGLDLITCILIYLREDRGDGHYLKNWIIAFSKQRGWLYFPWIHDYHFFRHHGPSGAYDATIFHRGLRKESQHSPPIRSTIQGELGWGLSYMEEQARCEIKTHNLQLGIYRQRAWALFDNMRLYPNVKSHFPTMDELDEQHEMASDMLGLYHERARRRSQEWQDYYSGRIMERPFDGRGGECDAEEESVEDDEYRLPRFFEKAVPGKVPKFWRHIETL